MSTRVAIIVQARMTSTRFPGKVLAPVLGKPLLAYQIERLQRAKSADLVVMATTNEPTDDPVAELAESMGCVVFRGSEDDVLDRYLQAARVADADTIVRITADCPLIDPAIIDASVDFYRAGGYDWMAPEHLPDGMGMDVFSRELLETMGAEAADPPDREHVTMFAIRRPGRVPTRPPPILARPLAPALDGRLRRGPRTRRPDHHVAVPTKPDLHDGRHPVDSD